MATMKEIAQICGVSRGTVDRVINRRGKVRPETERMILQAVERMGYTKSMLGRALSVKRSQPVIGVVLCSEGNPLGIPWIYACFHSCVPCNSRVRSSKINASIISSISPSMKASSLYNVMLMR